MILLLLLVACSPTDDLDGDGFVGAEDCDEGDIAVHAGALEVCDGRDQDCDGLTDEGVQLVLFADADADGYGVVDQPVNACAPGEGAALQGGDCDDTRSDTYPGAPEICDGLDQDCDGLADPGEEATWYPDLDGDGFGDPTGALTDCADHPNEVRTGGDCDDTAPETHPGAPEICDGLDQDCDTQIDEGLTVVWHPDDDGDGHGDPASATEACAGPEGWVTSDDDCAPADPSTYPGAPDPCDDGVDQDCDGEDPKCSFDGDYFTADAFGLLSDEMDGSGFYEMAGDLDGDGLDEVVTTALYMADLSGGGWVVNGPITADASLSDVALRISSLAEGSFAGRSLSVADVDGDGVDDLGLGVPMGEEGLYVRLGPITADATVEEADHVLLGPTGEFSGHGAGLGDVNGDGLADAAVGAYTWDDGRGLLYLSYAPLEATTWLETDADAVLVGPAPSSYTGRLVSLGSDLDGDGIGDIAAPAPYQSLGGMSSGALYVVHGPVTGTLDLNDADGVFAGVGTNTYAGVTATLGDLDGDGLADIAVGSYNGPAYYAGTAYVVAGPATGSASLGDVATRIEGDVAWACLGTGLNVGDVDLDGQTDLLVGAPGDAGGRGGRGFVFYGPLTGLLGVVDAGATFYGGTGLSFGQSLAAADLGEGVDLVVGAPGSLTRSALYVFDTP